MCFSHGETEEKRLSGFHCRGTNREKLALDSSGPPFPPRAFSSGRSRPGALHWFPRRIIYFFFVSFSCLFLVYLIHFCFSIQFWIERVEGVVGGWGGFYFVYSKIEGSLRQDSSRISLNVGTEIKWKIRLKIIWKNEHKKKHGKISSTW